MLNVDVVTFVGELLSFLVKQFGQFKFGFDDS